MSLPSNPSFTQMPNNFRELFDLKSKGLINLTRTTKLTAKRVREVAKTANNIKKTAKNAKEVTDNLKKGNFKKVNGSMANAIGFALSLASIGLSLLTINHVGNLQEIQLRKEGIIEKDLNVSFQNFVKNALTIRKLREEFNKFKNRYNKDKGRLLNQVQESFKNSVQGRELSEKAKKQANDALYETREGRKKLEAKISEINNNYQQLTNEQKQLVSDIASQNEELNNRIEESRKLGNDALYEVREGRRKLEAEINDKFQAARKLGNDALYETRANRQKMEANFGQELNSLRNNLNSQFKSSEFKTAQQVKSLFANSQNIINNAVAEARAAQAQTRNAQSQVQKLQQRINKNQSDISRLSSQNPQLNIDARIQQLLASSPQIRSLLAALKAANVRLDGFNLGLDTIRKAFGSNISTNTTNIQIIDGRITKLEQGVELKGINVVNAKIAGAESRIKTNSLELDKLKKQFGNNKLNSKQYNDLIQKISLIPPLIARVPSNTVRRMPRPLTTPQIEAATNAGVCRSTQNGGCMKNALDGTANTINQNTNNWGKNLFEKINAGANAAQLALLKVIDKKLGPQIGTKGLSGAFKSVFENKLVDRAIALANLAGTTHNALMLSNNITQTLYSATDNILNVFGVKIKDEKGSEIGIQQVINNLFLNFANTLFGAENVKAMNANFKKANRVYQSASNIVDSVRSMTDSVKNVAEFTAENTGKIGNALKTYQVIAPDAYKWMPEQVNGQSVWMQRLQNLEEAASGIEMVSGEVLSVTQNANEIKKQLEEFNKGVEDLAPKERNDNKPVAEKIATEKAASVSPAVAEVTGDTFRGVSA